MQKKRDRKAYMAAYHQKHKEKFNAKSRKYYAEHTKECKQLVRDWKERNPEKEKAFKRKQNMKNLVANLARVKAWKAANPVRAEEAEHFSRLRRYWLNPEKKRQARRDAVRTLKLETLKAYGGTCFCCGEDRPEFLTIDHANGGGTKHIRTLQKRGQSFYLWLKNQGFPQGDYRVACWNCNCARGMFGKCPHEDESGCAIGVAC
jgi:hypothetical protein